MKKRLIKICTSIVPLLIFNNLIRYNAIKFLSRFKSKHAEKNSPPQSQNKEKPKTDNNNTKKMTSHTQLCFLLGSARSGTTLTSILLDKSPNIFSPPELYLAAFKDLKQRKDSLTRTMFKSHSLGLMQCISRLTGKPLSQSMAMVRALEAQTLTINETYDHLLALTKEPIFIDKTPCYATYLSERFFSQRFPMAKYLYMYRHPISVILSQKKWLDEVSDKTVAQYTRRQKIAYQNRKTNYFSSLLSDPDSYWEFEAYKSEVFPQYYNDKFKLLEAAWYYENQKTLAFLDKIADGQKYIFSFESLLKAPEQQLKKTLRFLNIDSDPKAMIDAYECRKAPTSIRGILKAVWNMDVGDPNQIFLAGKLDGSRADKSWQSNVHLWEKFDEKTRELTRRMGYKDPNLPAQSDSRENTVTDNTRVEIASS